MHLEERRISGQTLYEGNIITLQKDRVLLEDNRESIREVVRHPGGVAVAAIDSDQTILFVRQYRYPYAATTLELPAGKLDIDVEAPEAAIVRELSEETGYRANRWESLGIIYPTPGYCDEVLHLYLATDLVLEREQHPDDGEFLDLVRIPLEQAVQSALSGELKDAKTVVILLKIALLLQQGNLTV